MSKKELWIVIVILIFTVLLSITAYFFAGFNPIKESSAKKRFSAPPGKTRENPLLLVSSKREDTFQNTRTVDEPISSPIKKIQSAKLDNEKKPLQNEIKKQKEQENRISADLQKLLDTHNPLIDSLTPELEEKLSEIYNTNLPIPTRINIIKNNLDLLLTKGLSNWVSAKLNEILNSADANPTQLVETNWLLSLVKKTEGEVGPAETHFQTAWEKLLEIYEPNNPEHQELLRLIGINYTRFLRTQNKVDQADTITKTVEEKLKYTKTQ